MPFLARLAEAVFSWHDERHGPLPSFLLVLTFVTGLVDAVSYLKLGHVFVANMTGNVVFLGFAVADAQEFSILASLASIAAFLVGALAGGRLGASVGQHRGRYLAIAGYAQTLLIGVALVIAMATPYRTEEFASYALIVVLASAMGLQNAVARRLGVPDLTTTVLTLTLTGLAADSALAGGKSSQSARRVTAAVTMFLGATVGALLVLHVGVSAVLMLVLALQISNGIAAYRLSSLSESWTIGS